MVKFGDMPQKPSLLKMMADNVTSQERGKHIASIFLTELSNDTSELNPWMDLVAGLYLIGYLSGDTVLERAQSLARVRLYKGQYLAVDEYLVQLGSDRRNAYWYFLGQQIALLVRVMEALLAAKFDEEFQLSKELRVLSRNLAIAEQESERTLTPISGLDKRNTKVAQDRDDNVEAIELELEKLISEGIAIPKTSTGKYNLKQLSILLSKREVLSDMAANYIYRLLRDHLKEKLPVILDAKNNTNERLITKFRQG